MRKTPKTNGEANLPIEPKNPDANRLSRDAPCMLRGKSPEFQLVGTSRLELLTPSVSRKCSSHLSYAPT